MFKDHLRSKGNMRNNEDTVLQTLSSGKMSIKGKKNRFSIN